MTDSQRRTARSAVAVAVVAVLLALAAALALPRLSADADAPLSGSGTSTPGAVPPPVMPLALDLDAAIRHPLPGVPAQYRDLVNDAAATCPGLPPTILAAQIEAESTWNPSAVSEAGAQGMAQFLPSTWKHFGVDANGDGTADPFDPQDAVYSAANYDCDLLNRLGDVPGDAITNMLAAYHAGPGQVVAAGGMPPFPATSHYVWHIYTIGLRHTGMAAESLPGA